MGRVDDGRPIFQKTPKVEKPKYRLQTKTPMRPQSRKRAKRNNSKEGRAGLDHMGLVKTMDCCACGAPGPSDAHHCKDQPPFTERFIYKVLPVGEKSHPKDTIPLCKMCHQDGPDAYHRSRDNFAAKYGPDYSHIEATRDAVSQMTGDIS